MLDRILIFTNLKELAVHDVRIPDELYEVFHRLPSLRRLCIRRCQVGHQVLDTVNEPSASSLAIHELTLRDLTMTSHHLSSEDLGYSSLYMLSAAPHLRALSIEWNSVAARYFSGPHRLSSHLRRVDINVVKKSADDGQALMAALVAFIIAHPSVVHLSITNISLLDLPIYALPNLRSYTGPPFHSLVDAESRPLVHLELIDSKGLLLKKLSTLPTSLQRLRSLSLFIPCWNDEVLHAVVFHFPRLRALEIAYRWLHPSEVGLGPACMSLLLIYSPPHQHTLLSMGSQFLCRIPELHTVKVYNYGLRDDIPKYSRKPFADYVTQYDDSENERFERHESEVGSAADDATGALQELILAWRHWCPSIRVVQLWHSFLWRRSYDGGAWVKRTAIRDRFREARSCWPFAEVVGDDEEAGITCHARYADPA
jgi:hypothetical protein